MFSVVALGLLGDFQLHVEQLAQIPGQVRQLLQVQTADVQVGLHELQGVGREDAVAPHEAVDVARREDTERPLQHRFAGGVRFSDLHLFHNHLVLPVGNALHVRALRPEFHSGSRRQTESIDRMVSHVLFSWCDELLLCWRRRLTIGLHSLGRGAVTVAAL